MRQHQSNDAMQPLRIWLIQWNFRLGNNLCVMQHVWIETYLGAVMFLKAWAVKMGDLALFGPCVHEQSDRCLVARQF
jgi:hypothetical protein